MAEAEIVYPWLANVGEIKIFLADDTKSKRDTVFASLGALGLGENAFVEVATDFEQAQRFMNRQQPGALEANVFMIDGSFGGVNSALTQGPRLFGELFRRYFEPIEEVAEAAEAKLQHVLNSGLTLAQLKQVVNLDAVIEVAVAVLQRDALFMGISDSKEGQLRLAQIPRIESLTNVGEVILKNVLGSKDYQKHLTHLERMQNPHYAAAYTAKQA